MKPAADQGCVRYHHRYAMQTGAERELWLHKGIKQILPGHADRWATGPSLKLLFIVDAKFGYVEVDSAPLNLQLRTYAVQAAQQWDVEHCVVAIVQPRANTKEGAQKLSIARYDRKDIELAKAQLLGWHTEWTRPGAPRRPSESACRHCKARHGLCDEYTARMMHAGTIDKSALPSLAAMNDRQFIDLFLSVKLAREDSVWDALNSEAQTRVLEGRMKGFRLKPNSERRAVTDSRKAFLLSIEGGLVTAEEYAAASKPSLGDLQKTVKKKRGLKGKVGDDQAENLVNDTLRDVIAKRTPQPSVVQIDPDDEAEKTV